jgi:glyoxylase-like metal-dependent hydrolase (beta-lactamase superfamily II)
LGGTAYLIIEPEGNVLVDCPAWNATTQDFLTEQGGVQWLVITHRGAIGGPVPQMQATLGCQVVMHEQEAYLLPDVAVTTFQQEMTLNANTQVFWSCGHSPGSACVYSRQQGGILFSGRHLLPDRHGNPTPLRTAKTFHWRRQLQQVQRLRERFSPATLRYICPGASIGFLRGKPAISGAYQKLTALDLERLADRPVGIADI